MRMASKDMKIRTSLLDARYLCGDEALYAEFDKAVGDYLTTKNGEQFIREKLAESEELPVPLAREQSLAAARRWMKKAEDAVEIISDGMIRDEVVANIVRLVRDRQNA